jgi:HD-GYP domain-containing protein (c-di-GMP phosphodiesterase class II)
MDIELSISFGWGTKTEIKQQLVEVLKNAEDMMYRNKILSNTSRRSTIIKSVLNTLIDKFPREGEHSIRVSSLCRSLGLAYGLDSEELKELTTAGELHDIGKIVIDEAVLNKPGALTDEEYLQIRHHPEAGFRLLGATSEFINTPGMFMSIMRIMTEPVIPTNSEARK